MMLGRNAVSTVLATGRMTVVARRRSGLAGPEAERTQYGVQAPARTARRAKEFVEEALRSMRSYADEAVDEAIEDARNAGESGRIAPRHCARLVMSH